jgi:replicative DNA helicase
MKTDIADATIAERAVIGSLLLSPDCYDAVLAVGLTERHFGNVQFRLMWRAAVALYEAQSEPDIITMAAELTRRGELARVGGTREIEACAMDHPGPYHAEHFARLVIESANRRTFDVAMKDGLNASASGKSLSDVQKTVLAAVEAIQPKKTADEGSLKDMLRAGVGTEKIAFMPWAWPKLNHATGGLPPASLVMVGAYPGIGKTTFALSALESLARRGVAVDFYSIEMTKEQFMGTIIARAARVSARTLRERGWRDMPEPLRPRMADAIRRLGELPFHVAAGTFSAEEVAARARIGVRKRGTRVIAVDYLQLLRRSSGEENRRLGIDDKLATLKALAQSTGLAVLLLSQCARVRDSRGKEIAPGMAVLKESGGIGETADMILMLDRPKFREWAPCPECNEVTGRQCAQCNGDGKITTDVEITISVEKAKFGGTSQITLAWNGPHMSIHDEGEADENEEERVHAVEETERERGGVLEAEVHGGAKRTAALPSVDSAGASTRAAILAEAADMERELTAGQVAQPARAEPKAQEPIVVDGEDLLPF